MLVIMLTQILGLAIFGTPNVSYSVNLDLRFGNSRYNQCRLQC